MNFVIEDNALISDFRFKDFQAAMAFMNEVAIIADKMNHHPEWSNTYNRVSIKLTTHDQGNTITEKDHRLAEAILEIAKQHSAK